MESIEQLAVKLKGDLTRWEEEVFQWACTLAQEVPKSLLESTDEDLMRQKDGSLKVEALKLHRVELDKLTEDVLRLILSQAAERGIGGRGTETE